MRCRQLVVLDTLTVSDEGLALDHVLVAASDLDQAEAWYRDNLGLGCVPGGEFDDGVATRVVPLGGVQYIELLTVFRLTDGSADVQAVIDTGGGCFGWAVSSTHIDRVAARLERPLGHGSITLDDGTTGDWSYVENDPASGLPFFVQYDRLEEREAVWAERFARAQHVRQPLGIHGMRTPATKERVLQWVGGVDLPVTPGAPGLGFSITFGDGGVHVGSW